MQGPDDIRTVHDDKHPPENGRSTEDLPMNMPCSVNDEERLPFDECVQASHRLRPIAHCTDACRD